MVARNISSELHELGIRMVSDFFEMEESNTFYLGVNTPHESVVDVINDTKPAVLTISATIYFHVPQVEALIRHVRENIQRNSLKILVAGKAFNTMILRT